MFLRAVRNERKDDRSWGLSHRWIKSDSSHRCFGMLNTMLRYKKAAFSCLCRGKNQDTVEFTSSDQDISQQTSLKFHLHNYLHLCLQPLPINPSSKQTLALAKMNSSDYSICQDEHAITLRVSRVHVSRSPISKNKQAPPAGPLEGF